MRCGKPPKAARFLERSSRGWTANAHASPRGLIFTFVVKEMFSAEIAPALPDAKLRFFGLDADGGCDSHRRSALQSQSKNPIISIRKQSYTRAPLLPYLPANKSRFEPCRKLLVRPDVLFEGSGCPIVMAAPVVTVKRLLDERVQRKQRSTQNKNAKYQIRTPT